MRMAAARRSPLKADDLRYLKHLRVVMDLLQPLHASPSHGNRKFFMDHYVILLLLHFFNPILGSLRALQQATTLDEVQQRLGLPRMSLSAMSVAAAQVFDPALLEPILQQVNRQLSALPRDPRLGQLPGRLMATDGSFLRCLPRMVWALFRRKSKRRGVQLHLQFDVERGIPDRVQIGSAVGSEKKALREALRAGCLYVVDRGFIEYKLFQAIHDAGSFFVARLKDNSTFETLSDRILTAADQAAGVVVDQSIRMGSAFTEGDLVAPVRRIVIRGTDGRDVILLTDTDLAAEIVALIYRYRWQVELFFRWFKCILGCRHWLSESERGLTLQVYVAILASLLVSLLTGRKPTRRTFEMIVLHLQGWASAEEVQAHIARLQKKAP
jgi:hypothetical protein